MMNRLIGEGKTGAATNAIYDAWTPARAYQHYHGAIGILTEAASVRYASPIRQSFSDLRPGLGYDPRVMSWKFPALWKEATGGCATSSTTSSPAMGALENMALYRERLASQLLHGAEEGGVVEWCAIRVHRSTGDDVRELSRRRPPTFLCVIRRYRSHHRDESSRSSSDSGPEATCHRRRPGMIDTIKATHTTQTRFRITPLGNSMRSHARLVSRLRAAVKRPRFGPAGPPSPLTGPPSAATGPPSAPADPRCGGDEAPFLCQSFDPKNCWGIVAKP
jgi:hypothetical protein